MIDFSSLQIRNILEPRLNQMTPKEVREVSPLSSPFIATCNIYKRAGKSSPSHREEL